MRTKILYGKPVADAIRKKLKLEISKLFKKKIIPNLSVILIGENPASKIYVNTKHRTFLKYNCKSVIYKFEDSTNEKEIIELIKDLNEDNCVHGILVQLPIPKHINFQNIINKINPIKDVDGLHPYNLGCILSGKPNFIPCTPNGCIQLLDYYNITVKNKHVVIIGRSNIVGKPLMALLSQRFKIGNATVTICHTGTKDIKQFTLIADILVVAAGKDNLINSSMIKKGVHIIDVGINRIKNQSDKGYSIIGDVNYQDVLSTAKSITPVPGGIGPLTITMLLNNTVQAAKKSVT